MATNAMLLQWVDIVNFSELLLRLFWGKTNSFESVQMLVEEALEASQVSIAVVVYSLLAVLWIEPENGIAAFELQAFRFIVVSVEPAYQYILCCHRC